MAKKIINIGSSPNKGDGDPIRTAFEKVNENFTELYEGGFDRFLAPKLTQEELNLLIPEPGLIVYNTTTGKFQGYAEDANNDSTSAWTDLH